MPRRAMVAEHVEHDPASGHFTVELTDEFIREAERGTPIDRLVAAELLDRPALFDLYAWLLARAHRDDRATVPVFEAGGIRDLLDMANTEPKARQQIRHRMIALRESWPELPYALDSAGNHLLCTADPLAALTAHLGADALQSLTKGRPDAAVATLTQRRRPRPLLRPGRATLRCRHRR